MENTLRKFIYEPLFDASRALLNKLNVKYDMVSSEPFDIRNEYVATFNSELPQYAQKILEQISATYFVGIVNDEKYGKDDVRYKGLLFFAADYKPGATPTRSDMANLTRLFNRISADKPVVAIMRQSGKTLSIATCERTDYQQQWRQSQGERIGKVCILRGIDCEKPHRGHLDILESLVADKKINNFDDLYEHWQKVFSTELLTKQFYNELFEWYKWAISKNIGAYFPNSTDTSDDDFENIDKHTIRLITRLMFVWFIKQKDLVPEILFDAKELKTILKNFDPQSKTEGNYYNAILQNLFFATLNRAIEDENGNRRGFAHLKGQRDVKTLYRYEEMFSISEAEVIELFGPVPFLNGGLFECLDKTEKLDGKKINPDGFSRNDTKFANGRYRNRAFVPNILFFDPEKGLFKIFDKYQFTVEENTPSEQQVALDPELLGKVFENLLGAYNPETEETARKQSGSFYTPPEIVKYMVDESLITFLGNTETARAVFADGFEPIETHRAEYKAIVERLKNIKVFDPACGSGAFPMGILNRIVDIMQKIDPTADTYETKLHIIENCIYGSDIQTIATQITKLRFFISLICHCDKDPQKPNFGIPTLPNLETKFVTANSLIGLKKETVGLFEQNEESEFNRTKKELHLVRHKHFIAKSAREKMRLREEDKQLREKLADLLFENNKPDQEKIAMLQQNIANMKEELKLYKDPKIEMEVVTEGATLFDKGESVMREVDKNKQKRDAINTRIKRAMSEIEKEQNRRNSAEYTETIEQLLSWNPYDQNAVSHFFDAEWMFGVSDGFDVVIGNPPYVLVSSDDALSFTYKKHYTTANEGKTNLYKLFYEFGLSILNNNGILSFITPNTYLTSKDSSTLRSIFFDEAKLKEIIEYTEKDKVFENVTQAVTTIVLQKGTSDNNRVKIRTYKHGSSICLQSDLKEVGLIIPVNSIIKKIQRQSDRLSNWFSIYQGEINLTSKCHLFSKQKQENTLPMWRGNNVGKYWYTTEPIEWCDVLGSKPPLYDYPRIIMQQVSNQNQSFRTKAFISPQNYICGNSTNGLTPIKPEACLYFFLGIINSKTFNYFFDYFSFTNHITATEIKNIPIPTATDSQQAPIITLVNEILAAKKANPQADTSAQERAIDELVYELYGLTEEERKVVEGK
ncbi:MAG: N-6 DNA methylase [Bacteroidales bacterium]|nr:N-6 DNA methylase [Bacteroidales bacterium]